jgi:hypothetical protein
VEVLLKHGLGFIDVKFSLEVSQIIRIAAAIGSTASIGKVEVLVNYFFAGATPTVMI